MSSVGKPGDNILKRPVLKSNTVLKIEINSTVLIKYSKLGITLFRRLAVHINLKLKKNPLNSFVLRGFEHPSQPEAARGPLHH